MPRVHIIPTGTKALEASKPSDYVSPAGLRDGDPNERQLVHLTSTDGKFLAGTWYAQPYAEYVEEYPGDEYTHILEGQVTLTDADGTQRTFGPGTSFMIASGWSGEYRVDARLTKEFVFYFHTGTEQIPVWAQHPLPFPATG